MSKISCLPCTCRCVHYCLGSCLFAISAFRVPVCRNKSTGCRESSGSMDFHLAPSSTREEDAPENVPELREQEPRGQHNHVHVKPTSLSLQNVWYLHEKQVSGCYYFRGAGEKAQAPSQARGCCRRRPQGGSETPEVFVRCPLPRKHGLLCTKLALQRGKIPCD